jgi:phage gpG-like protein
MKLADLAAGLARLDLDAAANAALGTQARLIGDAVREALSHTPGESHRFPWKQSGALQQSIGVTAEGNAAVIGAPDPVALWQEHGTAAIPPRPFLAPVAQDKAASAAASVGAAAVAAIETAIGGG